MRRHPLKTNRARVAVIAALVASGATASGNDLVGHWTFENPANLGQATIGADMAPTGAIVATAGIDATDSAADVPVGAYFTVTNPIGANGSGVLYTNEYTLLLDIKMPMLAAWIAIADFDNGGDGDYFYSTTRGLGVNSEGYVGDDDPPLSIIADTWHRIVIAIDNGILRETYVDGVRLVAPSGTIGHLPGSADGRWAQRDFFDLFSDNGGGEEMTIHVTRVAHYDRMLTDTEIVGMGGVDGALVGSSVGTNYCTATINSTGAASTLAASGSNSIAANDLTLSANNLPSQPGIFIAGPASAQIPFFNGYLCVSPSGLQRFATVNVPASGVVTQGVDLATSTPGGINAVAGQPYFYQRWNRDPAAGGAGANFSDGLEVNYLP